MATQTGAFLKFVNHLQTSEKSFFSSSSTVANPPSATIFSASRAMFSRASEITLKSVCSRKLAQAEAGPCLSASIKRTLCPLRANPAARSWTSPSRARKIEKARQRGRPRKYDRVVSLPKVPEDVKEVLRARAEAEGMTQTDLLINLILTNQV